MVELLELYHSRIPPANLREIIPEGNILPQLTQVYEYQALIRRFGLPHMILAPESKSFAGVLGPGEICMTQNELAAFLNLLATTIPPDCPTYLGRLPKEKGRVEFVFPVEMHADFVPLYPRKKRKDCISTIAYQSEVSNLLGEKAFNNRMRKRFFLMQTKSGNTNFRAVYSIDEQARIGVAVDGGALVYHFFLTNLGAVFAGIQH